MGTTLGARVHGHSEAIEAALFKLEPRGSKELVHASLAAPLGGPLTVSSATKGQGGASNPSKWELLSPRFSALLTVPGAESNRLFVGQRATIYLEGPRRSIGGLLVEYLRSML